MTNGRGASSADDDDRPGCLAGDEILAFVADELDPDEQARIDSHLERCASCLAELEAHYEELEPGGHAAVDPGFLVNLQQALFGPPPASREVLDELWSTLALIRTPVPGSLRVAPPRPSLAAAALAAPHASSPSGNVGWEVETGLGSLRLSVWAKWPELAGTALEIRIDGVPITGRPELPHLVLAPGEGALLRAEIEIRREHLEPLASSLADLPWWRLDVGPARGQGDGGRT